MSKRTLRLRETERKGRDKIHSAVSTACAVKGSEKGSKVPVEGGVTREVRPLKGGEGLSVFCSEGERRFLWIRGPQTYKGPESKYFRLSVPYGQFLNRLL